MDELRRKLELLEEQNKAWRTQHSENEKRIQLDYERKVKELDEYYKAAAEKIDLEFSERRAAIIIRYSEQNICEKSVKKEQHVSDHTISHGDFDNALRLRVSEEKNNESESVGQALQSSSDAATTIVRRPDHRTSSDEYICLCTAAQSKGKIEFVYAKAKKDLACDSKQSGLFGAHKIMREIVNRFVKRILFDPGGTDRGII
ncbi:uncharacterized protein LOC134214238 [Armigeres subalbatus]|uniref:uncharacterized protein LOC134214238 n=1 Tax=Armigeres subalbatus TaxID=124917 RepID=UPI002ED17DC6